MSTPKQTFDAVRSLRPGCLVSVHEQEDGNHLIEWDEANTSPQPTDDEITAAIAKLPVLGAWRAYQAEAQAALAKSDVTILRCAESAVAVPPAWAIYRAELRSILAAAGGTPGTLPARPDFPAGT